MDIELPAGLCTTSDDKMIKDLLEVLQDRQHQHDHRHDHLHKSSQIEMADETRRVNHTVDSLLKFDIEKEQRFKGMSRLQVRTAVE